MNMKNICEVLCLVILLSCMIFKKNIIYAEDVKRSFDPEYVMWTDQMIEEGFADMSPNMSNKTSTGIQSPYGRAGDELTEWAYYEFLWTHGYPIGNGRMAAMVMGAVDKELIQINEDTVWAGSPYIDLATGEPTGGSRKDGWKFYRGANKDGTPAEIGSSTAMVGNEGFQNSFPEFKNKSVSNMALNVDNSEELEAVQHRYNLNSMIEKYFLGNPKRQKAYQSFVELYLDFGQENSQVENYTKSLDMRDGVVTIDYDYNNTHYKRESFASYPDQVIVTNIKSDGNPLNFTAELHTYLNDPVFSKVTDNQIKVTAKVKDGNQNEVGGKSLIRMEARLTVDTDGIVSISSDNKKINVSDTNQATVYIVGASNYVNYLKLDNEKPANVCNRYILNLKGKSYNEIKNRHLTDFRSLFNRSSLTLKNIDSIDESGTPTEKRVRKNLASNPDFPMRDDIEGFTIGAGNSVNNNTPLSSFTAGDNQLATLMFNYGKYLLISGSRDADSEKGISTSQPLNLTGKWNPSLSPSWSGKYTININTEMNYWLAQPLNLAESEKPLLAVLPDLAESGSITAREQYAITNSRGDDTYQPSDPWVMHHNFDLWRGTQPIDNATAGVWPTGGVWLLDHAWQYYKFNLDKEYLVEIYPLMKGACDFFTQFLVVDPLTGYLITAASVSPEQGSVQPGPAMDTQLIRNLYHTTLEAAKILGKANEDSDLLNKIKSQLPTEGYFTVEKGKLAPNLIDENGYIKEWVRGDVSFDFSRGDTWMVKDPFSGKVEGLRKHDASNISRHRHTSHLWELYPGTHLNAYSNDPDEQKIYEAFKKTLAARSAGSGQGWGLAWRMNLSARALDGDTALERFDQLIRTRTSPNLMDQHPNFQIDGNFGAASGIAEMLLQSHNGTIDVLSALPERWPAGEFKGFKARGNIEVGVKWEDSIPVKVTLKPKYSGKISVRNPYSMFAAVRDESGNKVKSTLNDDGTIITFMATGGETYSISNYTKILGLNEVKTGKY